jgi:hypothetical protein
MAPERQSAAYYWRGLFYSGDTASKTQAFFTKNIKPFFLCTKVTGGAEMDLLQSRRSASAWEPALHFFGGCILMGAFLFLRRRAQKQIAVSCDAWSLFTSSSICSLFLFHYAQDS